MPEIEVKNLRNEVIEKLALSDAVFGAKVNQPLVWEAVRHYQAAQRRGTASTKTRAEVSGSGRKLWKQKGTGRARIGSIRNPLWRHGGTVHGPKPRDYNYSFPKKKLQAAMRSVLSERLHKNNLTVVDEFKLDTHKTKDFKSIIEKFGFQTKLLIVDSLKNRNLHLGSRNLPRIKLVPIDSINVFDLVKYEKIMLSKNAILQLQQRLS